MKGSIEELKKLVTQKDHMMNLVAIAKDQIATANNTVQGLELSPPSMDFYDFLGLLVDEHTRALRRETEIMERESKLISADSKLEHDEYLDLLQNLIEHKIVAYEGVERALRAMMLCEEMNNV